MKINMAVFFGCRSVEHEVSIISAVQAMQAVNKEKYNVVPVYVTKTGEMYTGSNLFYIESFRDIPMLLKYATPVTVIKNGEKVVLRSLANSLFRRNKDIPLDVAFPIVHGTNCEDGTMAGFFEMLGLPYIGCDVLSAALGMDKAAYKDVLSAAGLPVLPCYKFSSREYSMDSQAVLKAITDKFGLPVIIKPVNLGSSVGITKASTAEELTDAIDLAVSFSDTVIAERAITSLREINCSVLGDADECAASVCEEPIMTDEILSYADKYLGSAPKKGGKSSGSKGMASLGRKLPAELPQEQSEYIRELSCRIFKAMGCSGVVRIDYLLDTAENKVYANEINTIPGSLSFYLWQATGLSYTDMIDKLVDTAFRRQRNRENLTYTINTNILAGVSFGAKGAKGSKGGKF